MGILANNPQILTQPQNAAPQTDPRAQLAAEEAQMRAQVQQLQSQQQSPTQAIAAACQRIMSHGRGFPTIAGNASQPYSMTLNLNQPVQPGYVFAGQGQLAAVTLNEVAHFEQLANELDAQRPPQAAPQPAPSFTQQVQQAYNTQVPPQAQVPADVVAPTGMPAMVMQQGGVPSILPPNAPQSMPQLAVPQASPTPSPEAPAEAKKGRGRPKKAQDATPEGAAVTVPPPPSSPVAMSAPPATAPSFADVQLEKELLVTPTYILVNARIDGKPSKSLNNYVEYINGELSKRYSVNDDGTPGLQDVRCAPPKSILAFGGWKGAVREVVKSGAGLDGLEGTVMHLDTFMDDLNEAVADALRVVADKRGWVYIRGVR